MKKLALLFSLAFCAFVISASAQSSATTEKEKATTEKVGCHDGAKAKAGCCAYSTKECKAGSMKCCVKDKSEAKKSSTESKSTAEAVVNERKTTATVESK